MIWLGARPRRPAFLSSSQVSSERRRIKAIVLANGTARGVKFKPLWLKDDVRKRLWTYQQEKCCYCEQRRQMKYEGDVEHFRPKARVTGDPAHPGYWWLAYSWRNLFFTCKVCNEKHKRNLFPLLDGKRARAPSDRIALERPTLIDPSKDDPELCIDYVWVSGHVPVAKPVGVDEAGRGGASVEIAGLDSRFLNERRGEIIADLEGLVALMRLAELVDCQASKLSAARRIRERTRGSLEFVAFRRSFFRRNGFGKYVASD